MHLHCGTNNRKPRLTFTVPCTPVFILTFWPLTSSDFSTDPTFHQFHGLYTELDLHRIMSGLHGTFETDVACQQGTLILPDTWFRPPFWDLLVLQLLRPDSSNLPCLYWTFHIEYPLVLSRFCLKVGQRSRSQWYHLKRFHLLSTQAK